MGRVVVTGAGALSPLGIGAETLWQEMLAGKSGIKQIENFDVSDLEVRIGGEVRNFDPKDYIDAKLAKRMDRFSHFSVTAASEALKNAQFEITDDNRERVGVIVNTGGGGIPVMEVEVEHMLEKGPKWVHPLLIALFAPNMASCQVSMVFGIHGPTVTSSAACASGIQAFVQGYQMLERNEVDLVIAGGSEAGLRRTSVTAMANMGALSKRNDDPEGASRPFDLGRDGFVFAEGAGLLILEREEHALNRGAPILAELTGGAFTSDAFHITAPNPDGVHAGRAMSLAIERSGLLPSDIDYVAAHATATPLGDIAETDAVKRAFGDHAYKLALSANKSMVGHLLGAAGGVSAIACVYAIRDGIVPPTINLTDPDPKCDLDYVPNVARKMTVDAALANGFGFGGQNAVAVFKRYEAA
ncbi:MAG: beta-ketoacyl-ACP synthase II [Thermomicrobiales bacterium]|nr:beta-ketoacyl-ACP synthase II [Thermomicrobiales bacterium]